MQQLAEQQSAIGVQASGEGTLVDDKNQCKDIEVHRLTAWCFASNSLGKNSFMKKLLFVNYYENSSRVK